jgi:hypothetical protein
MSTGFSIALVAVGAILTFALEREVSGINLDAVGIILMIAGAIGLLFSALFWNSWSPYGATRRRTYITEQDEPLGPPPR